VNQLLHRIVFSSATLTMILVGTCGAQDDFGLLPFVNRANFDKSGVATFSFSVMGNSKEAAEQWNAVIRRLRQDEALSGVLVVREYPSRMWEKVATCLESPPGNPESAMVCSFVHDYILESYLSEFFEWDRTRMPELFEAVNSGLLSRSYLRTKRFAVSDILTPKLFIVSTPDYLLRRSSDNVLRVSLPKKAKREWPGLVDARLFGMCSLPQLMHPTNLDQWINIVRHCKLVSHERLDDKTVIQKYLAEGGPIVREFRFDTTINRVIEYIEYPVADLRDPFSIECYAVRTFHNRIDYDKDGRMRCFALGSPTSVVSGVLLELDTQLPVHEGAFGNEGMKNESTKVIVDKLLLDYIEVLMGLGIEPGY
jgi:hypothetical protein